MYSTQYINQDTFEALVERLQSSGVIKGLQSIDPRESPTRNRNAVAVFSCELVIADRWVSIHIGFDQYFPENLPLIYLVPPDTLGSIPHVEADGFVCYAQSEGILLNWRNPLGIISEAIEKVASTLIQGLRKENLKDFVDEFDAYWRQQPQRSFARSFISPSDEPRKIIAAKRVNTQDGYEYVSDDDEIIRSFYNGRTIEQRTIITALYVPLQSGSILLPPSPQAFWTTSDLQRLADENLSAQGKKLLAKLTRKFKHEELVIFSLPRPRGGEVLFGVQCNGVAYAHPLVAGGKARDLKPIVLRRYDKKYLLPRGGAQDSLADKRVALIGCGSVGGFIATGLVRQGILNLTLIDPDDLSIENVFRHELGYDGCGKPKVLGLKAEIERKYPYVNITVLASRVEDALEKGTFRPGAFDLIIVAVGIPSVSLRLNRYFHNQVSASPVLHTWLEAYGIGSHVLVTLNNSHEGCFECLFTPTDSAEGVTDRSSFAATGQTFAKDITGCASPFTPFGSLDSQKTASHTIEVAKGILSGSVLGNPLLSWKGSGETFLEAGYRVSGRYDLTQDELFKQRYLYYNALCPVCGGEQ